jgi:hypothetical protein
MVERGAKKPAVIVAPAIEQSVADETYNQIMGALDGVPPLR